MFMIKLVNYREVSLMLSKNTIASGGMILLGVVGFSGFQSIAMSTSDDRHEVNYFYSSASLEGGEVALKELDGEIIVEFHYHSPYCNSAKGEIVESLPIIVNGELVPTNSMCIEYGKVAFYASDDLGQSVLFNAMYSDRLNIMQDGFGETFAVKEAPKAIQKALENI